MVPFSEIASRPLRIKLSSAFSSSGGSAMVCHSPGGKRVSTRIACPSVRLATSAIPVTRADTSTTLGCSGWRRPNDKSSPERRAPRLTAVRARSIRSIASDRSFSLNFKIPRLAPMTCRTLLKSCAMPPVSCPIASSRWPLANSSREARACALLLSACSRAFARSPCKTFASINKTPSTKTPATKPNKRPVYQPRSKRADPMTADIEISRIQTTMTATSQTSIA